MTSTFEKLSSNKVKLNFTVEPEKFEEGSETDASGNPLAGWFFIKGLVG